MSINPGLTDRMPACMATTLAHRPDEHGESRPRLLQVADKQRWAETIKLVPRPVLIHLNQDTTWLLQLPYPPSANAPTPGRTRFNILFDPWLQGPQSDVASFFSTQWHVVAPSVATMAELNRLLSEIELPTSTDAVGSGADTFGGQDLYIDAVVISHEFTDHCHKETLLELPPSTSVYAAEVAAGLIRSWAYFDQVITMPPLDAGAHWSRLTVGTLPGWLAVGRLITPGNALYYHAATLVAFDLGAGVGPETVIYSPHGIDSKDLAGVERSGLKTLALLHGLDDVRIWMAKQLNLGALNAIKAVSTTKARYWIPTHDEDKKGAGLIARLLRRRRYTLKDAVAYQEQRLKRDDEQDSPSYIFLELKSGDGLVLNAPMSETAIAAECA